MTGRRELWLVALVGLGLGYSLSRIGFSAWDEVHAMFTFHSLRLLFTFATAVVTLAAVWRVVQRASSPQWTPRRIHRGTVVGGVLFGVGWAVSGACPGIAWVQIGEGQLGALWTLA